MKCIMESENKCNGKCENCSINQRTYCAAQMAYYNQKEIAEIKSLLLKSEEAKINTIIREEKTDINT